MFEFKTQFEKTVILEKTFLKSSISDDVIGSSQYQIMTTWILEHLDDLKCNKSTKYLAKTYLDYFMSKQDNIRVDDLYLIAITVSRIAVKSFQYSIDFAQEMGKFRYLSEQFIRMQNNILTSLQFNLNIITPYHYLPFIQNLLPLNQQISQQIQTLIDFSCTLKQLSTLSAAQLLLSILLYLAYSYDPSKISIIKAYQHKFPNISNIVTFLNSKASQQQQQ